MYRTTVNLAQKLAKFKTANKGNGRGLSHGSLVWRAIAHVLIARRK